MRLSYSWIAASALLIAAVAAAPAAEQSAKAQDTANLRFAWPNDLKADVLFKSKRTKMQGSQSHVVSMNGRFRITTSPVRDGLKISTKDFTVDVDGGPNGAAAQIQKLLLKAASTPPDFVVSRDGDFVRVDGLEEFRSNLMGALSDLTADLPDQAKAQVNQIMSQVLSKELLEANMASSWNRDVGSWLGADLDQGDVYEAELSYALPMFGNIEVPLIATFQFHGRVPCTASDTAKSCVDLEMQTFVNSERLSEALAGFISQFAPGQAPAVDALELTTTVRLITEPGTLLPHRMQSTKVTSVTMTHGGQQSSQRQVEEEEAVYRYDGRS